MNRKVKKSDNHKEVYFEHIYISIYIHKKVYKSINSKEEQS